jgi:hypothetical protein
MTWFHRYSILLEERPPSAAGIDIPQVTPEVIEEGGSTVTAAQDEDKMAKDDARPMPIVWNPRVSYEGRSGLLGKLQRMASLFAGAVMGLGAVRWLRRVARNALRSTSDTSRSLNRTTEWTRRLTEKIGLKIKENEHIVLALVFLTG